MKKKLFPKIIIVVLSALFVFMLSACSSNQENNNNLKNQLDEYITSIKSDGSLDLIIDSWLHNKADDSKLDYSTLTAENGTIVFGTKISAPFCDKKEDKYVGIVPEIMYQFCKNYGYDIEFMDFSNTNSLVLAVSSGKCDLGGSTTSVTEERKKKIDFSEPYFNSSGAIAINNDFGNYVDLSSLTGKRIGITAGTIYHDIIDQQIEDPIIYEYNNVSDMCQALYSHKVDAIALDYGVLAYALNNYPSESIVDTLFDDDHFAFVFPKNSSGVKNLLSKTIESINSTLIEDNRWKQIIDGVLVTLLITISTIVIGTSLGFVLCMAERKNNKIIINLINIYSWIIRGLPTVVLLMIMYYVIFGSSSLDGTVVSIISFSLIFSVTVNGLLKSGINSVDKGQFEACIALGYSEKDGFKKLILPQAILFSIPAYKTEIISLIKATSIVGYIAVQDLTKAGDVIRSSTYEAFFPLIITAIIYFALAWLMTKLVDFIWKKCFSFKEHEKFLKGVDRHVGN